MMRMSMMSLDVASLDQTLSSLVKDAIESNRMKRYRTLLNFVVICDENCIQAICYKISRADRIHGLGSMLRHFSKWLFLVNTTDWSAPGTEVDNLAMAVKCHQIRENAMGRCDVVSTLLWNKDGRSWSNPGELCENNEPEVPALLFPNTVNGLNGRKLKIGVMEWFTYCKKSNSSGNYSQVCRDIVDALAVALNFSYGFIEPPDNNWGYRLKNGSWYGLLGMVIRNEIDLIGVPYGITQERTERITYSYVMYSSEYYIGYKKRERKNHWLHLVNCFQLEVYVCGMIALFWCLGLYILLGWAARRSALDRTEYRLRECSTTITQSVMEGIRVPLRQAILHLPIPTSSRAFLTSWWVFCVIMTAIYTGNLTSSITVDKEEIPFRNLEELAHNDDYKILVGLGTFVEDMIMHSHNSIMTLLRKKVRHSRKTSYTDQYQHYRRLLETGRYAYISDSEVMADLQLSNSQIGRTQPVFVSQWYLPFPKNSPLAHLLSEKLMPLYDNGVIDRWKQKWALKITRDDSGSRVIQLHVTDIQSAIVACGAGIFAATFTLVMELIFWGQK